MNLREEAERMAMAVTMLVMDDKPSRDIADLIYEALKKATASQGAQQGKCARCNGAKVDTYVNPDTPSGFTERPCPACAPDPDLGLSLDMLDADRLRRWAEHLDRVDLDMSCWGAYPLPDRLRNLAERIETAVRDIGILRKQAALAQQLRELVEKWRKLAAHWAHGGNGDRSAAVRASIYAQSADELAALLTDHPEGQ